MRNGWKLLVGTWMIALAGAPSLEAADRLEGAWRLEAYELGGAEVPVEGVMLFTGGRFGAVYTMGASSDSGRGHAGEYRLEGDRVEFRVPFWVERVDGKARVYEAPVDAGGRIEQEGDALVIRFDSGSMQKLRKLAARDADPISGAWRMKDYRSPARTGPADGLALFADGHFVLVYTMKPEAGGLDGRAHAGSYRLSGEDLVLEVARSLHYVSGKEIVDAVPSERKITAGVADGELTLDFGKETVQKFASVSR